MLAANSDATGCIKMMLDEFHDEFQQNETTDYDTPDNGTHDSSIGDEVNGVFDPMKSQFSMYDVLCRAIRNGKR